MSTFIVVTARDTESVGGKFGSRSTSSAATKKSIKSEEKDDSKEVLDYLLRDDVSLDFITINVLDQLYSLGSLSITENSSP